MSPAFPEQQSRPYRDAAIGDIERGKCSHLDEIRNKAIGNPVDHVGDAAAENEAEADS